LVLRLPGGRRQQRRDADEGDRDPAPAVGARHRHLEREGPRAERAASPVPRQIRARQLHSERFHPVLVDARDGIPRLVDRAARPVGRLAFAQGHARPLEVVPARVAVGRRDALHDEHRRLAVDRGRRQPWIVQGLMKTIDANSPSVSSTDIWISLIAFVLIYIALGVADVVLMLRYSRKGLDDDDDKRAQSGSDVSAVPALTY